MGVTTKQQLKMFELQEDPSKGPIDVIRYYRYWHAKAKKPNISMMRSANAVYNSFEKNPLDVEGRSTANFVKTKICTMFNQFCMADKFGVFTKGKTSFGQATIRRVYT